MSGKSVTYGPRHGMRAFCAALLFLAALFPALVAGADQAATGLRFLVLGDWGRAGGHKQVNVAVQMAIEAARNKADFIISTGDNFQDRGPRNVTDKKWQTYYENVYSYSPLMVPWYVVLGNHDYMGNVQAQIDYTRLSSRWNLPGRYYSLVREIGNGVSLRLIFLDTNPFVEHYHHSRQYKNVAGQDAGKQLAWLDSTLAASTGQWKIVVGHHPIFSAAPRHGDTPELQEQVKPLLEKYGVQAYFCGHDHNLQHLKPQGGTVNYFVSGGGSWTRKTGSNEHTLFSSSSAGFAAVLLRKGQMVVRYIDYLGAQLYSTSLKPSDGN
jgi:tartrate-resistant acid phosphatase type 5